MDRQFLLTLTAPTYDAHMMDADVLSARITESFTNDGYAVRAYDVRKYDPASEVYAGKIAGIKRVRTLIPGIGLRDAKFLVDTAVEKGSLNWADLTINARKGSDGYPEVCVVNHAS
jgi:hypothetical protein